MPCVITDLAVWGTWLETWNTKYEWKVILQFVTAAAVYCLSLDYAVHVSV